LKVEFLKILNLEISYCNVESLLELNQEFLQMAF